MRKLRGILPTTLATYPKFGLNILFQTPKIAIKEKRLNSKNEYEPHNLKKKKKKGDDDDDEPTKKKEITIAFIITHVG